MNRSVPASLATFLLVLGALLINACSSDEGGPTQSGGPTPITDNLFPLVAGHAYWYTGFLVDTNSTDTPVPGIPPGAYSAKWTLLPGPADTWLLEDSTVVVVPQIPRYLQIRKDTITGSVFFRQTLGPFLRRFGVTYTDTLIWVELVKPSVGVDNNWKAFDTTVTGSLSGQSVPIHLEIFGRITGNVTVVDSSAGHASHVTYRVRTWRKITAVVGSITITLQDDATTAQLWLEKDIGPVQVNIAGDTENYGHFRVLTGKSF